MDKKCNKMQTELRWHYCAFPEQRYHIDLGRYNTYGIRLTKPAHGEILHDVSACKETISRITELLNQHQVFPCHFQSTVEDLLQRLI